MQRKGARVRVGVLALVAGCGWMLPGCVCSLGQAGAGAGAGAAAAKKTCTVSPAPSALDTALAQRHVDEAEKLLTAMPAPDAATASTLTFGRVRLLLLEGKTKDAAALATRESAAHPDDAVLLDALGEARFRRGEVVEAANALNRARQLDPCLPRMYFDYSRFENLNGMFASAQRDLKVAHQLAPHDPEIASAWGQSQAVRSTPQQQLEYLHQELAQGGPGERTAELTAAIKGIETRQKGDCTLAAPVEATKFALMPIGNTQNEGGTQGVGIDLYLNGKRKRLELDTGASGLSITAEAARSLGLTPEARTASYGFGDSGLRGEFVTHVDDIKIGTMDFHNCMVHVFESKGVLQGQDGLIGADVFRKFLVTIDFPSGEVRLGPLPKRPDEAAQTASLGTDEADSPDGRDAARVDRYVAPEMKNWTPVFRSGHMLIVTTGIGKAPAKLFVLDTGSASNLISPAAAREVTQVAVDSGIEMRGVSGEVKKVLSTGPMAIQFAGIRQNSSGLISIDTSSMSVASGVEISGFIGYETLRELTVSIDYRDDLIKVTYTPHLGTPSLGAQR